MSGFLEQKTSTTANVNNESEKPFLLQVGSDHYHHHRDQEDHHQTANGQLDHPTQHSPPSTPGERSLGRGGGPSSSSSLSPGRGSWKNGRLNTTRTSTSTTTTTTIPTSPNNTKRKQRVVTTPSWAKNFPPDLFPDEVDEYEAKQQQQEHQQHKGKGTDTVNSKGTVNITNRSLSSLHPQNRSLASAFSHPQGGQTKDGGPSSESDPKTTEKRSEQFHDDEDENGGLKERKVTSTYSSRDHDHVHIAEQHGAEESHHSGKRDGSHMVESGENSTLLAKPEKIHSENEVRRSGDDFRNKSDANYWITDTDKGRGGGGGGAGTSGGGVGLNTQGGDRWWTFTLPSKYLDRVQDYVQRTGQSMSGHEREEDDDDDDNNDDEAMDEKMGRKKKRRSLLRDRDNPQAEKGEYERSSTIEMGMHLNPPYVYSMNQTQTPGWSAPWTPFRRDDDGLSGRHPADPFASQMMSSKETQRKTRFEQFVLKNPFAPLFFRTINLAMNVSILGLAAHSRLQQKGGGVIGIMGSSTLMAICVSPLAIIHIFINLYIEYFGRPIGLWRIRTKMAHTLSELIFICLFSSTLSLSFDDLLTSPLECTSYTPYARFNTPPPNVGTGHVEGSLADSICGQQVAQVVLLIFCVIAYIAVLVVSLFRIFAKVNRK